MWLGNVCIIEGLTLVAAGSTAAAAALRALPTLNAGRQEFLCILFSVGI